MIAEFLVIAALPALLVAAAGWDIASYTIPNFLSAALIGAFAVFVLAAGMAPAAIGWHLLAGFIGFVVGFTVFALGYVGGGDAKLFACVALWFGLRDLSQYALIASVFGGMLTLGLLSFRKLPLPALFGRQGWLMRLHDEKAGIPYGAALAAGAFAVLPYTDVFRLGVTA
ncbi:MAG: prepilin peptidase [Rhizomicrobium sp.]